MSASLRNRRGRFYTYSNAGVNGVVSETYQFMVERWVSFVSTGGRQTDRTLQAEHVDEAVIGCADDLLINPNDVVMVDSALYRVRSVSPRRAVRELELKCEAVDDEQLYRALYWDGTWLFDGTYTLAGASSALVG